MCYLPRGVCLACCAAVLVYPGAFDCPVSVNGFSVVTVSSIRRNTCLVQVPLFQAVDA